MSRIQRLLYIEKLNIYDIYKSSNYVANKRSLLYGAVAHLVYTIILSCADSMKGLKF